MESQRQASPDKTHQSKECKIRNESKDCIASIGTAGAVQELETSISREEHSHLMRYDEGILISRIRGRTRQMN